MPRLEIVQTVTPSGRPARQITTNVDGDNLVQSAPTVPVAKVGALTVRSSTSAGTLTMDAGHGFNTADKISLFWDTGSRHGVVVGTVATNSVPISGGTGDDLPTLVSGTYAITAMVPHQEVFVATAANVIGIDVYTTTRGYVEICQANGTAIATIKLEDGDTYFWFDDSDSDNPVMAATPLGADIGLIKFSHDDSDATADMEVSAYYD